MSPKTTRTWFPPLLLSWPHRLEDTPVGARLARGVAWSAAGAVAARGLALLASIITARLIGRDAFGALGIAQSTLSLFATFALFGLNLTATKYVAEFRATDPARAGRILALSQLMAWSSGALAALLMAATSPALARLLSAPELGGLLALSALALLFTVVYQVQSAALLGFEAFRRNSMIQAAAGLVSFPATLAAVWLWGLPGAILGLVVSAFLLVVLAGRGVRAETARAGIPVDWHGWQKEVGILWRFSMPTVLCGAIYVPVMWLANVVIVQAPGGYAAMGLFSAADRWRTAIAFVPTLLASVTLPLLSSLPGRANHLRFRHVQWTSIALSGLAATALAVPIALASPWIMASYGPGFAQGQGVLVTLCAASIAASAYWTIGQSLISQARVWTMFGLNTTWALLFMGSVWLLRERGAAGLATAYLIADGFRLGLALLMLRPQDPAPTTPALPATPLAHA